MKNLKKFNNKKFIHKFFNLLYFYLKKERQIFKYKYYILL